MTAALPVPHYGESALADLSSSVLGSLGVPGAANVLELPELPRACVLVIDGMGWELLRAHPQDAPFLSALPGRPLTAGFPATTVTSLSSLSTGLPPGEHGMLGLQLAVPGEGRMLNCLRWTGAEDVDPATWQPRRTVYGRAADAGVKSSYIASGAYVGTGFNRAITRDVDYVPADSLGQLVARAEEALAADRAHVTVYHADLDSTGHMYGAGSKTWRHQLRFVDLLAERIAEVLPPGTGLYVTADHGMSNPTDRVDIDRVPALTEGVAMVGGEARARHVYTAEGAAADVQAAWSEVFGDRAWVMSREEAVAAGCFGPVAPGMLPRIGDVVAVARGDLAILKLGSDPFEGRLVGMHGSLVPEEQLVPLLSTAR